MRRGCPLRTSCPDEQLFLPRHAGRFFSDALCIISALKKLWRYTAGSVHFTYRLRRSRITCRIAVGLLRSPDLRDLNGRRFASLTRRHHWTVSPPLANLATTYDFKSVAAEAGSGGAAFLLTFSYYAVCHWLILRLCGRNAAHTTASGLCRGFSDATGGFSGFL